MAVQYKKDAASLHESTKERIDKRVKNSKKNRSWWMDSALYRWYSMLEWSLPSALEKFTEEELQEISGIVNMNPRMMRNMQIQAIRFLFTSATQDKHNKLKAMTYKKLRRLPVDELLALIDYLEQDTKAAS